MARHLLYFQQVMSKLLTIKDVSTKRFQAGLISLEVKFHVWEWEEELRKLTLEDVGLGRTKN